MLHIKVYKLNLCNHENEIFICCVVPHDGLSIGRSAENLQISEHETIGRKAYWRLAGRTYAGGKIALLGSDLAVPRLGILSCRHHEGLHGLALGGPAAWGGRKKGEDGKIIPTDRPTTIFPQSYGLGATWDVDLVKK